MGNLIDTYIQNRVSDFSQGTGNNNIQNSNSVTNQYSQSLSVPNSTTPNNLERIPQSDSISICGKDFKKKNVLLSLGATALATAVGVGAFFITKNKNALKMTQNSEFAPANSLKEAFKYAKKQFGVTYQKDTFKDLELVNYFNEWMAMNKKTMGNSTNPQFIIGGNSGLMAIVQNDKNLRLLTVNLKGFEKTLKAALDKDLLIKYRGAIFDIGQDGKVIIKNDKFNTEYVRSIADRINTAQTNPNAFSLKDKMLLQEDIRNITTPVGLDKDGKYMFRETNPFLCLDHEQGHYIHQKNNKNFNLMADYKLDSQLGQQFKNDETIQNVARKVSGYATTTPAEFVAETYKFLKSGQEMPKDVMTLYEKYGGPIV